MDNQGDGRLNHDQSSQVKSSQANYKEYKDNTKQSWWNKNEGVGDNNYSYKNKYQGDRDPANVNKDTKWGN